MTETREPAFKVVKWCGETHCRITGPDGGDYWKWFTDPTEAKDTCDELNKVFQIGVEHAERNRPSNEDAKAEAFFRLKEYADESERQVSATAEAIARDLMTDGDGDIANTIILWHSDSNGLSLGELTERIAKHLRGEITQDSGPPDSDGWISVNDKLPPEGRDDIQMRWSEVGSAKGGVPTHWRFKPVPVPPSPPKPICGYCGDSIESDEPIVTDGNGEEMHIGCSAELQDGDDINSEY